MTRIARFTLTSAVALAMLLTTTDSALAQEGTFAISVKHNINGRSLGLSKELPVWANVYLGGSLLTSIPLEFKDSVDADLPAGNYLITVTSVEIGDIPSMQLGPIDIPGGVSVSIMARLSGHKTPILDAQVK